MKMKIARLFGMFFALFCIKWKRKVPLREVMQFLNYSNYIIVTKTKWCFTNLFIRGKYKHAAIIIKDGLSVVEATTHGVRETDLTKFLETKSSYKVFRPIGYSQHEKDIVESIMYDYIGRPYDWLFFWEDRSLYCSELVATVFNRVRKDCFKLNDRIIEPSELLENDVEVVNEFH